MLLVASPWWGGYVLKPIACSKAEQRIGDCLSAFTLPHWIMALSADGRDLAAKRLLDEMRAFGRANGTASQIVSRVAVPICEAVLAAAELGS